MKDWRVISMEKTLAVLTDGLDTGRGALALCKFKLEMDRKDPYFRGLR